MLILKLNFKSNRNYITTFCVVALLFILAHGQKMAPLPLCLERGLDYQYCTQHNDKTLNEKRPDIGWCCHFDLAGNYEGNSTCGDPDWCTPNNWATKK